MLFDRIEAKKTPVGKLRKRGKDGEEPSVIANELKLVEGMGKLTRTVEKEVTVVEKWSCTWPSRRRDPHHGRNCRLRILRQQRDLQLP